MGVLAGFAILELNDWKFFGNFSNTLNLSGEVLEEYKS